MTPISKFSSSIKLLLTCVVLLIFTNCKKDSDGGKTAPKITLQAEQGTGQGQYLASHEYSPGGSPLSISISITPASEIQSFTITKTANLSPDPTYGQNGALTVDLASVSSSQYTFSYSPTLEDVNKLIGFKFTVTNKNGVKSESDLTLTVNLSPAGNLPFKKWQLKSIFFVTENEDVTEDCNKDDFLLLETDGKCLYNYGALSCNIFEEFDTPQTWELSSDEKTFTLFRLSGFTNEITPQVYEVKELTLTTLKIQLTVDMTALGGGPNDTFLYTYTATAR